MCSCSSYATKGLAYPDDTADGLGNVLPRVLGFTCSNTDHLYTSVRESSVDECRPKASEASGVTRANVFFHRTLFPVSETPSVVVWCTTKHNDETQDQETNHRYDLDGGENNPDRRVVFLFLVPEIDEKSGSRDLSAERDGVLIPVCL
jgi:hypothetical protein